VGISRTIKLIKYKQITNNKMPLEDLGVSNFVVGDLLVVRKRLTSNRFEVDVAQGGSLFAEDIDAGLIVDMSLDPTLTGVSPPITGTGGPGDPLFLSSLVEFMGQNGTQGGGMDFMGGYYWSSFAGPWQAAFDGGVVRFSAINSISQLVLKVDKLSASTSGLLTFEPRDTTTGTTIPAALSGTLTPTGGINLDSTLVQPRYGTLIWTFDTPLPPSTPFTILVDSGAAGLINGRFILLGVKGDPPVEPIVSTFASTNLAYPGPPPAFTTTVTGKLVEVRFSALSTLAQIGPASVVVGQLPVGIFPPSLVTGALTNIAATRGLPAGTFSIDTSGVVTQHNTPPIGGADPVNFAAYYYLP
jgi:hypothetical protein